MKGYEQFFLKYMEGSANRFLFRFIKEIMNGNLNNVNNSMMTWLEFQRKKEEIISLEA